VFVARFAIEFLKEPQVAFESGWALDLGQWLSIPAVLVGVLLILAARGGRPSKVTLP
jgi:phosphatidylglycerol:prolipoprotein diacylglycerol transferase